MKKNVSRTERLDARGFETDAASREMRRFVKKCAAAGRGIEMNILVGITVRCGVTSD